MRHIVKVIVIGLDLALAACADNSHKNKVLSVPRAATIFKADTTTRIVATPQKTLINSDTLFVSSRVAVFIRPDSLRIEQEKKKGREEDFCVVADDYLYYMRTAQEFLDSVKVVVVDAENEKFIQFVGNGKKRQLITVNKLPEPWTIYLFDPAKKAKEVDMTAIEEEYKAYFN